MIGRGAMWIGLAIAASGWACTKPVASFCCLTLEDCQMFDVDEVRTCEGEQVCVANECVPTPDAPLADGRPDGPGPDAADPCTVAGGQIVFTTDRDGDFEIARMWADGSGFQQLTSNTWPDTAPLLSRNLDRIAFNTSPAGTQQAWVMDSDGTDPHLVVSGGTPEGPPAVAAWSPTIDRLLVVRNDASLAAEIYGVDWDGANLVDLTTNDGASDRAPSWAPDGSRITFHTNRDDGSTNRIYVMNADGSAKGQIRPNGTNPRWSPSGLYIAFHNSGLVRTTSTGVGETSMFPGIIQSFNWSSDSAQVVACVGTTLFHCDLHAVRVSDSNDTPISTITEDWEPAWSPDGTRVVFTSRRDGNDEIYVANADGTGLTNLTNAPGSDKNPRWAPCPE